MRYANFLILCYCFAFVFILFQRKNKFIEFRFVSFPRRKDDLEKSRRFEDLGVFPGQNATSKRLIPTTRAAVIVNDEREKRE